MDTPVSKWRTGWRMLAIGVTAAAVAYAIMLLVVPEAHLVEVSFMLLASAQVISTIMGIYRWRRGPRRRL